jgi:hypothetical protein
MSVMNDGDPVVIFAGYGHEMDGFVRANAGLFRRIDVRYDFANYSCSELATILRHEVEGGGFALCPRTVDTASSSSSSDGSSSSIGSSGGGGDSEGGDDGGLRRTSKGSIAGNVAVLLEKHTSADLRAAMNGGLARQLFRKARGKLDEGLSLDASPDEMCTLTLHHLELALVDIASSAAPPPRPIEKGVSAAATVAVAASLSAPAGSVPTGTAANPMH